MTMSSPSVPGLSRCFDDDVRSLWKRRAKDVGMRPGWPPRRLEIHLIAEPLLYSLRDCIWWVGVSSVRETACEQLMDEGLRMRRMLGVAIILVTLAAAACSG